ncbi:MAG: nuclear transport factor 2 family protein [Verrucomicrobia bacterium]|nr:nuclear transport factor 2 family protein [Verrucomicrobiota bacterium]
MPLLPRPLPFLALGLALLVPAARAAEDALTTALRAADDERVAATIAADRARLAAIYADDLHYAHSNGKVDTKASQIEGLATGPNHFESFTYGERTFTPASPGVSLMKGRVSVGLRNRTTGQPGRMELSYLAVWRLQGGQWRFLAWQSCRLPEGGTPAR